MELLKYVTSGMRVKKKHFETIYDYLNLSTMQDEENGVQSEQDLSEYHHRLGVVEEMLRTIITNDILASSMIGPCNYFYFSGFGSGMIMN